MLLAPALLTIALCSGSASVELGPVNDINGPSSDKLADDVRAVAKVSASLGGARQLHVLLTTDGSISRCTRWSKNCSLRLGRVGMIQEKTGPLQTGRGTLSTWVSRATSHIPPYDA